MSTNVTTSESFQYATVHINRYLTNTLTVFLKITKYYAITRYYRKVPTLAKKHDNVSKR